MLAVCVACACGAMFLARRLRGHTSPIDAVHALIWLHPWQVPVLLSPSAPISLGAGALASAAVIVLSCGWKPARAWLLAHIAPRLDQRHVVIALLTFLLWIVHLELPTPAQAGALDASRSLGIAHAFKHGMQAGVDWLMLAGPFGAFEATSFDRQLFWTKMLVWEGALGLALAALLARAVLRINAPIERVLLVLALLVLPIENDAYLLLGMIAATAWILESDRLRRPAVAIGLAVLCLFALTRSTLFLFALACAALLALHFGRARTWRAAAAFVALFLAALAAAWMLAGQSLWNLPVYCARSWELLGGYSEAMSREGAVLERNLARYSLAIGVVLALIEGLTPPRAAAQRWRALLLALAYAVAYKAAVTRTGDGEMFCFSITAVAPGLLCATRASNVWIHSTSLIGRAACVLMAMVGMLPEMKNNPHATRGYLGDWGDRIESNVEAVYDLAGFKTQCERGPKTDRGDFALPQVRSAVGQHTIDAISWDQSLLLRNGLTWKPRLTFQSYAAYTPKLLELNARNFEGEGAPDYVLLKLQTIDRRLPAMDDGLALQVIARDYEAELVENGHLLLRRSPRTQAGPPPETLLERYVSFGETIDLRGMPGKCQVLSLEIEYSVRGRLRKWFGNAPPLFLELFLASGELQSHRIVPAMMRTGVILNPQIQTVEQWQGWHAGDDLPRVEKLRLPHVGHPELYSPRIRLRLYRADAIAPRISERFHAEIEYSMFKTPPTRVQGSLSYERAELDGREVLQVNVPSSLVFEIAPGKHVITGKLGVLPRAYAQGKSDGVSFRISLRHRDPPEWTVLLERFLDPRQTAADRGLIEFEIPFENASPAQLTLRTAPGPRDDAIDDWACWTDVLITH